MPTPVFIKERYCLATVIPKGSSIRHVFHTSCWKRCRRRSGSGWEARGSEPSWVSGFFPGESVLLEFLHPVTWDDELTLRVGVSNVGTHSFSFSVEGRLSPDVVAFTASLTQVCVSPDTREVMEVPAQLRALLA